MQIVIDIVQDITIILLAICVLILEHKKINKGGK